MEVQMSASIARVTAQCSPASAFVIPASQKGLQEVLLIALFFLNITLTIITMASFAFPQLPRKYIPSISAPFVPTPGMEEHHSDTHNNIKTTILV